MQREPDFKHRSAPTHTVRTFAKHMDAITRIFLGWDRPLLVTATEWLVQKYGTQAELDLSQVTVVVPGRRAGRRLLELLVLKCEADSCRLTPPLIETLGALPEQLYPLQRPLASDLVQQLVWAKVLRDSDRATLEKIVPRPPSVDDALAWWALGTLLWQQHRELAADGRDFGDVVLHGREVPGFAEAARWEALRQIQDTYLRTLDDLDLWDVQTARLVAIRRREPQTERDIVLVGTADMNQATRQVLDLVAARVTALVAAPEKLQANFDSHGCLLPAAWLETEVPISLDRIRVCDGPAEQATQVARELAVLGEQYRADEIVVGLADDRLGPFIERELAACGVTPRWIEGLRLSDSGPCRLLLATAEFLERQRFEDFASLVRHPDFDAWFCGHATDAPDRQAESSHTVIDLAALDELFRLHLPFSPDALEEILNQNRNESLRILNRRRSRTKSAVNANSAEAETAAEKSASTSEPSPFEKQAQPFIASVRALLASVREFLQLLPHDARPLNQWAAPLRTWLLSVYGSQPWDEDSSGGRMSSSALGRLNDVVEELAEIPESVAPKVTASDALRCAVRRTSGDFVPPDFADNVVELLGWLELPLDDTPVAVVTSFNEGFVPTSLNSDLFLPNELRRRLGLNDNARRFARDAYAVTLLQHSRRDVMWIVGRRDSDGNPLVPSRLLFATDAAALPDRVLALLKPKEEPRALPNESFALSDNSERDETSKPRGEWQVGAVPHPRQLADALAWPELLQPLGEVTLNVTEFRAYLACPYRYFLRHVLKLRTLDDDVVELDALAFGNILHDVLRRFGQSEWRDSADESLLRRGLLRLLDEVAHELFGARRRAAVKVQLRQLETRLEAFAHWQAKWRQEGWLIEHAETALGWANAASPERKPTFRVEGLTVWLHGRIDRIDRNEHTGECVVFDYKSGDKGLSPEDSHRKKKVEWQDLQLPLYRHLTESLSLPTEPRLGYINLPKEIAATGAAFAEWTRDDLADADASAIEVARRIASREFWPPKSPPPRHLSEFDDICQVGVFGTRTP